MSPELRRNLMLDTGLFRSLAFLAVGALVGLEGGWLALPVVLSLALGVGIRLQTGGCRVRAEGIWCRHGLSGLDLVPWSQVHELAEEGVGWRAETRYGTYHPAAGAWAITPQLAAALWQRARNEAAPAPNEVLPEQVAAWLGIAVDGHLAGSGWICQHLLILAFATVVGGGCFVACLQTHEPAGAAITLAAGLVLVGVVLRVPKARFRADAQGLELLDVRAQRVRLAWRDVALVSERTQAVIVLQTAKGSYGLPARTTNLDRLVAAIRQLSEARAAGAVLPRLEGDVPVAALSRAEAVTVSGERGLSVSRDGEPLQ